MRRGYIRKMYCCPLFKNSTDTSISTKLMKLQELFTNLPVNYTFPSFSFALLSWATVAGLIIHRKGKGGQGQSIALQFLPFAHSAGCLNVTFMDHLAKYTLQTITGHIYLQVSLGSHKGLYHVPYLIKDTNFKRSKQLLEAFKTPLNDSEKQDLCIQDHLHLQKTVSMIILCFLHSHAGVSPCHKPLCKVKCRRSITFPFPLPPQVILSLFWVRFWYSW